MKRKNAPVPITQKELSLGDIERGITKLNRRVGEVEKLKLLSYEDQTVDNVVSNIVTSISEIFGPNSREMDDHQYHRIWKGTSYVGMTPDYCQSCFQSGIPDTQTMLKGLIARLEEKKADVAGSGVSMSYQEGSIDLHSKIGEEAMPLYRNGHYSQSVFEAAKVLVNLVKTKAPALNKDGAPLMFAAFGGDNPQLKFNGLANQSEIDEQTGMAQLFAGAVLGLRNPRGHEKWTDSKERAFEYIVFLSLLAKRLEDIKT